MTRITDLAQEFCVDPRTMLRALRRKGIRIVEITPHCRKVTDEDANRARREFLQDGHENTMKPLSSK